MVSICIFYSKIVSRVCCRNSVIDNNPLCWTTNRRCCHCRSANRWCCHCRGTNSRGRHRRGTYLWFRVYQNSLSMHCTITTTICSFPQVYHLIIRFTYQRRYLQIPSTVIFSGKRLSFRQSGSFFYNYIFRQKPYKSRRFIIFHCDELLKTYYCIALISKRVSAF